MSIDDAKANEVPADEVDSSDTFLRPRRPADDEIDMTPMIDCVFLLLIFFIVTFQADPSKAVPLPHAKFGNPVLGLESAYLTLASGEGNTVRIYKTDQADPAKLIRSSNLLDQEREIVDYIEQEIKDGTKQVIIKGDGKLISSHVAQVAKAVGKAADAPSLHIAVLQESR